jgi:hypothetical protein
MPSHVAESASARNGGSPLLQRPDQSVERLLEPMHAARVGQDVAGRDCFARQRQRSEGFGYQAGGHRGENLA